MAPRVVYRSQFSVPVAQATSVPRTDVSSGGLAIADAKKQQEDRDRAAQLSETELGMAKAFSASRDKLRETDWREKHGAFEEEAKTIRAEWIDQIQDRRVKQAAMETYNRLYLSGSENAKQDAREGQAANGIAEAETALDQFAKDAASARSPDERALAIENGSKAIANLVDAGWVPEDKAQARLAKFKGDADLFTAEALSSRDPYTARKLFGNQAEAQKRFPALDPRQILKLKDDADREVRQRETEAKAAQAAQSGAAAATLGVQINRYANGQADDPGQGSIDALKPSMTQSAWATIQKQYDDARAHRDKTDAGRVAAAAVIESGGHIDPSDTKMKAGYDTYWKQDVMPRLQAEAKGDPETFNQLAIQFIGQQGVIPETLQSDIRTSLRSGTPEQKVAATQLLDQLQSINSQVVNDFSEDEIRLGSMISANIDRGQAPAAAVRAAEDVLRTPKEQRKNLEQAYNDQTKVKGLDGTTTQERWLKSQFSDWFNHWSSSLGVLPSVASEADEIVRNEYVRNGGDLEAARKSATSILRARFGVSEVNGGPTVMRNPPEAHYQFPGMSPSETAAVIRREAVADLSEGALKDPTNPLRPETIKILPYPVIGRTAPDGKPAYALQVQDATGEWHTQIETNPRSLDYGLPKRWYPSLSEAKNKRDAATKAAIDEARGEVPAGAVVEGTAVYDKPKGQPRRVIGTVRDGKFVRQGN